MANKPNIIFMLADNVGWGDLSCYGGLVPTPRLDQLSFNLPLSMLDSSPGVNPANLNQGEIPAPIKTLRRTNTLISWGLLLPLLLIIMMTIFTVRSLRDLLRWWSGTFLTAGLTSLTLSLSLFPIVNWGFNNLNPAKLATISN